MVITEAQCFFPDGYLYGDPATQGFEKDAHWIEDRLLAWQIMPNQEPLATVVHLHGNAQNMSSHIFGVMFLLEMGFQIMAFDYSGYGRSTGRPTLAGIQQDALAVFEHVFGNPDTFGSNVFGFGQSMGAYVLARILPQISRLQGAVIEAGLYSFHDLFRDAMPSVENAIPDEGFSALDTLPESRVPKLFIHGSDDDVVPVMHSLKMHGVAEDPKDILILEGVGHLDATLGRQAERYKSRIHDFIDQLI